MATILVIDDNSSVRRVISFTLQKSGHQTVTAAHAREGLAHLANAQAELGSPIQLLILDVAMPEIDGLTLLRQLRADARYKHLPIIMLTASCDDQDQLTARAEGADEFLTKPTSSREIIEVVNRLLVEKTVPVS